MALVGTSVTVIGVVHASNSSYLPAAASYTIDSYPPISLPLPFTSRDIPNQAFFESEELPLGAHKLVVNVTTDGSPYTLNALQICTKNTDPVAAELDPTTHPASNQRTSIIIGSVVGGSVLMILAMVGYFLYRRRRTRQATRSPKNPVLSWLQRRMFSSCSDPHCRTHG